MRFTLAIFCALTPLAGQILPGPIVRVPPFPTALQNYLALTTEQVNTIQRLNGAYRQFETEKANRAVQVQIELAQETAKTPLDAMALGVRHVEMEAIRRELRAQQQKTYDEIQKLLTPAQKTKVQALIDAIRLQGVICEAQAENILPAFSFANRWFDTGTFNFLPVLPRPGQSPIFSGGSGQSLASFLLGPVCPASRSGIIGGLIQ
jgi:Spy/CpxP family protein refolding chaperone